MSRPGQPKPVMLIVAGLLGPGVERAQVQNELVARFGPVAHLLPFTPFTATSYYEGEMGAEQTRGFWAFGRPVDPGDLAELKLATNDIESGFSVDGKRTANLDAGLVDLGNLVLATGKPAGHRVYLKCGIWAEIEYLYQNGSFQPLPWTYPDYREPAVLEWFNQLRGHLKEARKETPCSNQ